MNALINKIEHLKNVGDEIVGTFSSVSSVTLSVVHENLDEFIEAAEHYGKVAEPLTSSNRLFFLICDRNMNINISVTTKDAVTVKTTYIPN